MATVPCLRVENMTEAEKRAYVLADNKLALNAGWDEELLAAELGALLESPDLDFDASLTGFSIAEIDQILAAPEPEEPGDPADDIVVAHAPRRVQRGTYGNWADTGLPAVTHSITKWCPSSWMARKRGWFSRTRRIICRSMAMLGTRGRCSTGSSPWPLAK